MPKWLILLSALLVTPVSGAPAWTWIDANGTVHFSDTPVPGAKQIELTGAQGFGAAPRSEPSIDTATPLPATSTTRAAEPTAVYRTLTISSPAPQEVLWNIGGNLAVRLTIEPQLQQGHRVDILMDGQRRNLNATGAQLSVPGVFRGSHSLQALIVDARGTELARSPAVTFTVQQTSIQNPQRQ